MVIGCDRVAVEGAVEGAVEKKKKNRDVAVVATSPGSVRARLLF